MVEPIGMVVQIVVVRRRGRPPSFLGLSAKGVSSAGIN